jgi:hypothetical protein
VLNPNGELGILLSTKSVKAVKNMSTANCLIVFISQQRALFETCNSLNQRAKYKIYLPDDACLPFSVKR